MTHVQNDSEALLAQATTFVRSQCDLVPETAIVLGSGLGGLADRIEVDASLAYDRIPGFQPTHAKGHRGRLVLGHLEHHPVIAMAGRYHRYEGWTCSQVVFPIRVMAALGAKRLILSNAAGAINPLLQAGEIVVIADHLNWLGSGGFIPPVPNGIPIPVPRRQAELYDRKLADRALQAAVQHDVRATLGTYLATLGPTYETRSEIRMMRWIGADVVGMSTSIEAIAGKYAGMRVLALSVVTNVARPDSRIVANHDEVLDVAGKVAGKMESIVQSVILDSTARET